MSGNILVSGKREDNGYILEIMCAFRLGTAMLWLIARGQEQEDIAKNLF
jgi:hypothetical protein